ALVKDGRLQAPAPTAEVIATYLGEALQQKGVVDLEQLRWSGMGRLAQFTAVDLLSGADGRLHFGEEIEIGCAVYASAPARNVSLGFSLFSFTGACVGTYFTRETFTLQEGETRQVRLRIS